MTSIIGRARWVIYTAHSPILRSFKRFIHTSSKGNETTKTIKVAEEEFISPELKRDLLEELIRSRKPMEYKIDGLPGPGDWSYEVTIHNMFEEFKVRQNLKKK